MEEHNVYENIVRARPSCIISLDNEHLNMEIMKRVNSKFLSLIFLLELYDYQYTFKKIRKPASYILTNTVRNWDEHYSGYFDEAFYTLALKQINKRFYVFPSYYVGQYGSYEALRHIYQASGLFKHYVKEDSILSSRENSFADIEKAKIKVGENFRQKHNISADDTVVFFSPGNTILENEYTLEAFRRGYNEFIFRNSAPNSLSVHAPPKSAFKLIVSVHKGTNSEKYVRDFLKKNHYETEVIVVTNEGNEHYDSICVNK